MINYVYNSEWSNPTIFYIYPVRETQNSKTKICKQKKMHDDGAEKNIEWLSWLMLLACKIEEVLLMRYEKIFWLVPYWDRFSHNFSYLFFLATPTADVPILIVSFQ